MKFESHGKVAVFDPMYRTSLPFPRGSTRLDVFERVFAASAVEMNRLQEKTQQICCKCSSNF
jgi:hypothetical protein